MNTRDLKVEVKEFWDRSSCGEVYATGESEKQRYDAHSLARYELEPYIPGFAKFAEAGGKDVLEIGVGMGADHAEWAKAKSRSLTGIDLTPRAVEHTLKRLSVYGLTSDVKVADAENLPFADNSFDIVYSWGVLHHSPDTKKAIKEVHRVLRPGGVARIMIYHKYSLTGYMLWLRYALLQGNPWRSLSEIYSNHLESPGTKAYSIRQTKEMFSRFAETRTHLELSCGDLLEGATGQRHQGILLTVARKVWPRSLFKKILKNHGLFLLIEAIK